MPVTSLSGHPSKAAARRPRDLVIIDDKHGHSMLHVGNAAGSSARDQVSFRLPSMLAGRVELHPFARTKAMRYVTVSRSRLQAALLDVGHCLRRLRRDGAGDVLGRLVLGLVVVRLALGLLVQVGHRLSGGR